VYNLHQHIKNDTDSTDVVENDYICFKLFPFMSEKLTCQACFVYESREDHSDDLDSSEKRILLWCSFKRDSNFEICC
jgi:hypothetical protein